MDLRQRSGNLGKKLILLALVIRLFLSGVPESILSRLTDPAAVPFLIYLETGRNVRFSSSSGEEPFFCRESPPPWQEETLPEFSPEDAAEIFNTSGKTADLGSLLKSPLDWDLTDGEPAVLILSTHTTESYTGAYPETSPYRTLEPEYNMLCVGDRVQEILEAAGIRVVRDKTIHDYPSYAGSYTHARTSLEALLVEYPTVRLVLDLHRDASGTAGRQLRTETTLHGQPAARLMLVMGTDASLTHDRWQENLSLALKLHVLLERENPGLMRPLQLRSQRFNQDLHPGMLLVEVGAAGNTQQEALRAAQALAEGIAALSKGAKGSPSSEKIKN